jgi:proteasome accessory factor B
MSAQLINRTERLTTIEEMLFRAPAGLRVVEIAEACGVDRRTVYRDLSLLSEIGLPVYQKDGRYFLNQDYYVSTVRLNLHEIMALYIAARALTQQYQHQNPHILAALKKLSKAVPDGLASYFRAIIDSLRSQSVDRAFVTVLETLTRAWAEQRRIKLWYRLPDRISVSVREFAMYYIDTSPDGSLYAVGYDFQAQRMGAIRLQWIKRVQLLNSSYEIPTKFDHLRSLSSAWGMLRSGFDLDPVRVVLRFAPDAVPLMRERLRYTEHAAYMTENAACVVSVNVSDWHEMLPWIRSWGTQVEVIEPNALREALAAEALKLAKVYGAASVTS